MPDSAPAESPPPHMRVFPIDSFEPFEFNDGEATTRIAASGRRKQTLAPDSSHVIVVHSGEISVTAGGHTHQLGPGFFGSFQGSVVVEGGGDALIVSTEGYCAPTLMGGPVEELGRLRYVDGCTATLLLPPPVRGEPCLNFMHLPPRIAQTLHTHPSLRVGLILSGSGQCRTEEETLAFEPGTIFFIPPETPHSFESNAETLRIVIFHPDSDSGPTHSDHTMLNRTFVGGESAQFVQAIHTGPGMPA